MKKKNGSTLALSAAVLALMLISAACSNNDNNANTTPSATPAVTASTSPDAGEESPDPATDEPSESPTELSGTGDYVGLADSHSIEVRMEDGTVAFQISPEIAEKVDPWAEGTLVKFTFTSNTLDVNGEKVTQYTIQSIDKQ